MIQIYRLSKSFGTNIALHDIGLRIRKGEFVFITGPSGANNKTIYQNVALALEVTGERPAIIRKKVHQALRAVDLSKKEKAFPLEVSGGEQQRIAIARAIINDPMILIADEPTGNLDPDITKDIMVLFRSINLRGTTVIIATHSRELLRDTGQRIIVLNHGRIVEEIQG